MSLYSKKRSNANIGELIGKKVYIVAEKAEIREVVIHKVVIYKDSYKAYELVGSIEVPIRDNPYSTHDIRRAFLSREAAERYHNYLLSVAERQQQKQERARKLKEEAAEQLEEMKRQYVGKEVLVKTYKTELNKSGWIKSKIEDVHVDVRNKPLRSDFYFLINNNIWALRRLSNNWKLYSEEHELLERKEKLLRELDSINKKLEGK